MRFRFLGIIHASLPVAHSLARANQALTNIESGLLNFGSNPNDPNRNVAGPYAALDNYACWCFFGSNWRKGKGKAVNEIDQICKDLHDCYKCAAIDADNEGDNCEAAVEPYIFPSGRADTAAEVYLTGF